ncbi:MAG: helix-turn-helix transcriptional regulator [Planctomycetes bacterium]|nr:helix-turn-helix transcriptional regulator [Planctomycetota bacterium]
MDGRKEDVQVFSHIGFRSGWRSKLEESFCALHEHPHVEIVYHPTGHGWTELESGFRLEFKPGSAVIYPPLTAHSQKMECRGEDVVVQLEVAPLPEELELPILVPDIGIGPLEGEFNILAAPPAARTKYQQAAFDYRAAGLLSALLDIYLQGESGNTTGEGTKGGYAEHAFRLIREQYRNLGSVSEIATEIGISYDHLRHLFKERYGMTMQEWLIVTRLEQVRELLRYSNLPLKAIAPLCGFGSDRHLCAVFKERSHMSPGEFRARHGIN